MGLCSMEFLCDDTHNLCALVFRLPTSSERVCHELQSRGPRELQSRTPVLHHLLFSLPFFHKHSLSLEVDSTTACAHSSINRTFPKHRISTMSSIPDITSPPPNDSKAVLFFWAPWHEASCPGGNLDQALQVLQSSSSPVLFGRVEAEACLDLTELYGVTVVPTVILLNQGKVFERVQGDDVAAVTTAVQRLVAAEETTTPPPAVMAQQPNDQSFLKDRLERLIRSSDVMLFIKGTPSEPRCGFSRQLVEMLEEEEIAFGSFDVLSDEEVRQGLKVHSNWPTYPQLYVRGELVGGLDIVKELKEEGSLRDQLMTTSTTQSLDDRLKELVNRHKVMLFMKGLPSAPKCGFSRQICELLDSHKVAYDAFDILEDEEVRQGLKKYSDWPTYPQLYVNGELVGGLDICKEMAESGDLDDLLKA